MVFFLFSSTCLRSKVPAGSKGGGSITEAKTTWGTGENGGSCDSEGTARLPAAPETQQPEATTGFIYHWSSYQGKADQKSIPSKLDLKHLDVVCTFAWVNIPFGRESTGFEMTCYPREGTPEQQSQQNSLQLLGVLLTHSSESARNILIYQSQTSMISGIRCYTNY